MSAGHARPRVLISAAELASRVRALGSQLASRIDDPRPVLLALLDGAVFFAADLARAIDHPGLELRFVRSRSYRGTTSTGTVDLEPLPGLAGRTVVVVDDILDTGLTLAAVTGALRTAGVERCLTCVLLDKPERRSPAGLRAADLVGFTIPDRFVVGYGLDLDGRWRHLPDVCVLG